MIRRCLIYSLWTACLAFWPAAVMPLAAQPFDNSVKPARSGTSRDSRAKQGDKPDSAQSSAKQEESGEDKRINWFDYKTAELRALNKITGRTRSFSMAVGKTRQFGDIYIRLRACREPPPIEKRESAAFLQVWEIGRAGESQWVFSGWMFASSPALSSMDHPVYDVWLLDCTDKVGGDTGTNADKDKKIPDKNADSTQDRDQSKAQERQNRQKGPVVEDDDTPAIKRERLPAE